MSTLLSVRDLKVGFGVHADQNEVIHGVSFDLAPGETLAIVGESGSGKSVTAMAINRLVDFGGGKITGGRIDFTHQDGRVQDLSSADETEMQAVRGSQIGMIFQEPMTSLNPVLSRSGEPDCRGLAPATRRSPPPRRRSPSSRSSCWMRVRHP